MFLKDNQKYSKTKKRKTKYRNKRIQNTEIEKYPNTFEAMNNISGGAVLGVLERQSKGDEWMLGNCVTLPPPTCLVLAKLTHYQGHGMGWGRETIRHEHCNTSTTSNNSKYGFISIAQKFKLRSPRNIEQK